MAVQKAMDSSSGQSAQLPVRLLVEGEGDGGTSVEVPLFVAPLVESTLDANCSSLWLKLLIISIIRFLKEALLALAFSSLLLELCSVRPASLLRSTQLSICSAAEWLIPVLVRQFSTSCDEDG